LKNVIVTGAAGFIGSFLVEELIRKNYNVLGIDNFFRGSKDNISHLKKSDKFTFLEFDLCNKKDTLKSIFIDFNPDFIFHYAAINGTKYFYDIPYEVFRTNIISTQNLIYASQETNVKKIIYASSSEVYGHNPEVPTSEKCKTILNIETLRDSYASSKAFGEFLIKLFCRESKTDYLIYRIFNTYGPRMDASEYGQVVPEFIRKVKTKGKFTIIGNGQHTRSLCFVEDHTKAAVELIEITKNKIINIGNDHEITIDYLAKTLHKLVGKSFEPKYLEGRDADTIRRCPDIELLRRHIPDFKFRNLESGLIETISWYEKLNNN